jgi:hypothetical protein
LNRAPPVESRHTISPSGMAKRVVPRSADAMEPANNRNEANWCPFRETSWQHPSRTIASETWLQTNPTGRLALEVRMLACLRTQAVR